MPRPMYRSRSFKKVKRVTATGRTVVHYRRWSNKLPHCTICENELNGIGHSGGKSRKSNSRLFGGVLCSGCVAEIVKLRSRVEQGEMKLDDVGVRKRKFVLQLVAH